MKAEEYIKGSERGVTIYITASQYKRSSMDGILHIKCNIKDASLKDYQDLIEWSVKDINEGYVSILAKIVSIPSASTEDKMVHIEDCSMSEKQDFRH